MIYRKCRNCGANLDPSERCECTRKDAPPAATDGTPKKPKPRKNHPNDTTPADTASVDSNALTEAQISDIMKVMEEKTTMEWCAELFAQIADSLPETKEWNRLEKILLQVRMSYLSGFHDALSWYSQALGMDAKAG